MKIIDKLQSFIPPLDKIGHFCSGIVLTMVTYLSLLGLAHVSPPLGHPLELYTIAFIIPTVIGILKELYDLKHPPETAEVLDAVAVSLGSLTTLLFVYVVRLAA